MVTQYGMSKKFGLMGLETAANQYLEGRTVMNCSDTTAADVDTEVMQILKESYEEAKRLLSSHRNTLDQIADFLIRRETITGKEFMDIFHSVEGIDPNEKKAEESSRVSEKKADSVIILPDTQAGTEVQADAEAHPEGEVHPEDEAQADGEAQPDPGTEYASISSTLASSRDDAASQSADEVSGEEDPEENAD